MKASSEYSARTKAVSEASYSCTFSLYIYSQLSRKRPPLAYEKVVALREVVAYGNNQQNKPKTVSIN